MYASGGPRYYFCLSGVDFVFSPFPAFSAFFNFLAHFPVSSFSLPAAFEENS